MSGLTGDRDVFCSVEMACSTYRAIPGAELAVVPGRGHEISREVIALMVDFYSRH
jgi:hypothetical protein